MKKPAIASWAVAVARSAVPVPFLTNKVGPLEVLVSVVLLVPALLSDALDHGAASGGPGLLGAAEATGQEPGDPAEGADQDGATGATRLVGCGWLQLSHGHDLLPEHSGPPGDRRPVTGDATPRVSSPRCRWPVRSAEVIVVGEDDLEIAAVLAAEPAHGLALDDQLLDRRRGPEDLLIEPDDDAADRLADRPALLALAGHVALASAGRSTGARDRQAGDRPADGHRREPGEDRDPARGHERGRVVADVLADDARDPGRDRGTEHVRGEDPAVHDADVVPPESIGHERDGRRHGRDVVEPEEHRERGDRHRVVDERQEQQAHAPEAVVDEQEAARIDAVGQPAARDRADEVEEAHDRERARGGHGGEPVVDRVRDEVLADEAVGRGAADEERAGEEPEVRGPDRADASRPDRRGGSGRSRPSVTPSGRAPTSAGSLRTHRTTGTTSTSASTPSTTAPSRQPAVTASAVSNGKKMSCPVLVLAPRIPVTRPRFRTNQRVATVGPRTLATRPVPSPDSSPNSSVSCQISRTRLVARSAMPVTTRLISTTARTPTRAMSQPLKGPDRPNTTRPAAAANDTDAVDQPGSAVIDSRNAPGAERTPAVTSTTTAVTATTTHP